MAILFYFSPTSHHLHPLQDENCDSNSRLVVDEDDYGKARLERVKGAGLAAVRVDITYLIVIHIARCDKQLYRE